MASHFPRGSEWHRWDLHFHTPSSFDYENSQITNQQIVDTLVAAGIRVVAITDHHTIDVSRVRELQRLGGDNLTVLPGIELRDDHGGKPIHYICIFPEGCDLDHTWTTLQGSLGLTTSGVQRKGGHEKVYVPIERGARVARDLGGVVSIHAGGKSNSIEEISNKEQFQQRIKFDITRDWVDLLEIGQIKDIDRHHSVIFPATGLDRPLCICSDNHDVSRYEVKAPLWFRADPTFRGLLMTLREPRDRVHIGAMPDQLGRVKHYKTKYIKSLSFATDGTAGVEGQWFQGSIEFNSGLVAIVGNKGSGKSALGDTLGLLGATRNSRFFPFLSRERFRHPISGSAQHFSATLAWESGETPSARLSDEVPAGAVERVKYLPQDHLERICNELTGAGQEGFERELRSVIFSHVPEANRLGRSSLDDLIRFQTEEKQRRIDSLLKRLREESRTRAALEARANPLVRTELEEQIKRRQLERQTHLSGRPLEVPDPTTLGEPAPETLRLVAELDEKHSKRLPIIEEIAAASETLNASLQTEAAATHLLEKLGNFQKEYDLFFGELEVDASRLGLKAEALASLSLNGDAVRAAQKAASQIASEARAKVSAYQTQLEGIDRAIAAIDVQLDAPNRAYQAYRAALDEWAAEDRRIEGSPDDPASLRGLEAARAALETLPAEIDAARLRQEDIACDIWTEKVAQVAVYRSLYAPVQAFIDSHDLAKERMKLEFRAELTNDDFSERLLALIAQNRRGTFMGIDEGRAHVQSLTEQVVWETEASVRAFLAKVDYALRHDLRPGQTGEPLQVVEQLARGKGVEEIFDAVYGLEYLRPRYVLRWEGRELSMLSPGERGTLLLVFYLLIDKDDIPLIIDQPEGNLDNFTVAKLLVDCIKEARRRRQVFIVTHNPNLAVVCDADQVVHAAMDKTDGSRITYSCGSLENPETSQFVTDVLEGTRWAFAVRDSKYRVGAAETGSASTVA